MKDDLKPIKDYFLKNGKLLSFQIGQNLSSGNYLPGQVVLIESGKARLISQAQGNLKTLKKLEPGSFVGIASLLNGKACEEVRACEKLTGLCISDKEFQESYENYSEIKKCCDNTKWDAEMIFILDKFIEKNSDRKISRSEFYKIIYEETKLITSISENLAEIKNKQLLFTCSVYGNSDQGQQLKSNLEISNFLRNKKIFSPRIISLSKKITNFDTSDINNLENSLLNKKIKEEEIKSASIYPPISNLNEFVEDERILARGKGSLKGTIACFEILSNILNFPFRKDTVENAIQEYIADNHSVSLQFCGKIASYHGFQIYISKIDTKFASRLKTPAIIPWKDSFAVVLQSSQEGLKIASPNEGFFNINCSDYKEIFPQGIDFLLLEKSNLTQEKSFGISWFLPVITQYKGVLIQVFIAGFVVQLFTLANPLLIQVIIDKVISQRSLDTLQVLGIALLLVTILEGILSTLKTFLLAETTNRIDQRLAAQVLDHLLGLPLNYFEKRPTGELSSRVDELEKIRNFITGTALTTILDASFSVIYIFVMILYSITLTLISLAVLPIQICITLLGAPLFRRQFRKVAEANAESQSHLVEMLNGIETVKSQNVEVNSRWRWQELYSNFINRSFEKTLTGTTLIEISEILQKLSQLFVLWVGASFVLSGKLSLGQLIAFRIISGYVTQPLLRLSTIWQNIQELKVSFERLADVIDTPREINEIEKNKIQIPKIKGAITFEKVEFSFNKNDKPILKNINLSIKSKNFIGIVGQSGSGKSTLMKLLPRLYSPNKGRIMIDGYDISKVELDSLRNQIGIVPQEPLLFSGTISENIALTNNTIKKADIIQAAKLADAHDFIMELPDSYNTKVNERGSSLSGGQRQRITIARTLMSKPKLLILDEATSALDYISEKKVCDNLLNKLSDCTVFFITHRLQNVRNADIIIMMHNGMIEDIGNHNELMNNKGRYYALFKHQEE